MILFPGHGVQGRPLEGTINMCIPYLDSDGELKIKTVLALDRKGSVREVDSASEG